MPMRDVSLVLGPVVFQDFEIPDRIGFGGDQRLVVHELPGGTRVVDALGAQTADIGWAGVFSGPDATLRARTLDALRTQGAVLPLSWDVFFYSVVIRSLEAEYTNAGWVPYRVRVSVVLDAAQPPGLSLATLAADAIGDAAAAAGFALGGGIDLSALNAAVGAPDATVLQTASYVNATVALAAGSAQVQTELDASGAAIAGYAGALPAGAVPAMILQAGTAASCAAARGYLGRLSSNMQHASS